MTPEIIQLQSQIDQLQKDLDSLSTEYYRGNFTATQDIQKYSRFNNRIKIPHYAATPTLGEVGELVEVGGIAYICSTANNWTKIGTQS